MTVEKLIQQYKDKVKEIDEWLVVTNNAILNARRSGETTDLFEEKNRLEMTRQIYFQFTKDLEDLL